MLLLRATVKVGLALALITRLMLLATLAWIVGLTAPVLTVGDRGFSWRDLILIGGGLFLLYKATVEIHEMVEKDDGEPDRPEGAAGVNFRGEGSWQNGRSGKLMRLIEMLEETLA